jgi:hypothetical protein
MDPSKGALKMSKQSQAWWHMPIIPALRRLRQDGLGYRARKKKSKH